MNTLPLNPKLFKILDFQNCPGLAFPIRRPFDEEAQDLLKSFMSFSTPTFPPRIRYETEIQALLVEEDVFVKLDDADDVFAQASVASVYELEREGESSISLQHPNGNPDVWISLPPDSSPDVIKLGNYPYLYLANPSDPPDTPSRSYRMIHYVKAQRFQNPYGMPKPWRVKDVDN